MVQECTQNHYPDSVIEPLADLAPFLTFLRENPDIMIHWSGPQHPLYKAMVEILKLLDINPDRLVWGAIRAHVVYLPQSSPCGRPLSQNVQLLSHELNRKITQAYGHLHRNKVILIQQTKSRRLSQHKFTTARMASWVKPFDLELEIFSDESPLSLSEQMMLFNRAVLVVGPTGAGLSNLVYSRPGTSVIEVLCSTPPLPLLSIGWLSRVLGHRFHGIIATNKGSVHGKNPQGVDVPCQSQIGHFNNTEMLAVASQLLQTSNVVYKR